MTVANYHPVYASQSLKPATTVDEQITLLRRRNMVIDDEPYARRYLENIGYYRLSGYWYPFRIRDNQGYCQDSFPKNTVYFNDIVKLYNADRKLRTLILDGLERIEIALRTKIVNQICCHSPSFDTPLEPHHRLGSAIQHCDPQRFRSKEYKKGFDHGQWLETVDKRLNRALAHDPAIQHYKRNYARDSPLRLVVPLWVLVGVLDFSDISQLYSGLRRHEQQCIAESFGIRLDSLTDRKGHHPLKTWIHQFSTVRNMCAHHNRLWNRPLWPPAPIEALCTIPSLSPLSAVSEVSGKDTSEKIFGALVVMAHLVTTIDPDTQWPGKASKYLSQDFLSNPLVEPHMLGIPHDWDTILCAPPS